MKKPKIYRFWVRGFNCGRGTWRLFVYKSDYNKLLAEFNELKEGAGLTE